MIKISIKMSLTRKWVVKAVIPCLTEPVPYLIRENPDIKRNWIPAFAGMTFSPFFVSQRLMSIPVFTGI